MVDPLGGKDPIVPARQAKLLPLFQEGNADHPVWARDLKALKPEYRSSFANGLAAHSL